MFRFTNAGFSAMHVVYSFWDGNYFAATKEYQHCYADQRKSYQHVSEKVRYNV
jgi:hypothetical protein